TRLAFGAPAPGDGPLDGASSWGRVYWGGALFCLLADVEIREQTHGQKALDDALRALIERGGNVSRRWDVARVVEIGDAATGTHVLTDLYARLGKADGRVDVPRLLRSLGVRLVAGDVQFDDAAPRAAIRRALVAPRR
ncbi:MAG TPA: hypothetical protein VHB21_00845, partial [Minicystis sp.]|nr:hypothetical protein [Minicystis sp.]